MTPAEKRIADLLDRWLASLDLHLQYTDLSDEAYAEIQAWPKHDRPTRWVLEHAKQKVLELKEICTARQHMGDGRFAEALELMGFLANLVGAQHVDRFIPLAEPPKEDMVMPKPLSRAALIPPETPDVPQWYMQAQATQPSVPRPATHATRNTAPPPAPTRHPTAQSRSATRPPPAARTSDVDATREMPKLRPPPAPKAEPKKSGARPAQPPKSAALVTEAQQIVIADAIRLLSWGRTWHELAELIARMADRPALTEIRKILRTHRTTIEKAAKDSARS